jgi:Leucine-rich repeat (LRR) protein
MQQPQSLDKRLPQDGLRLLLQKFRFLNVLHLQRLAPVGDEVISILNECPSAPIITNISLQGCVLSYWCNQSFQLKNLQHVTISGGSIRARICALLQQTPNLKSLSIEHSSAVRDDDLSDIATLLHDSLESLTLHQCIRIHQPVLKIQSLSRLNMVGCFGLGDLPGFSCPNLRELNLSFCVRLSGTRVQSIISQLPNLEKLVMVKCSGVQTLHVSSKKKLTTLNLSYCNNIKELRLDCPSLEFLEVSLNLLFYT